MVSEIFKDKLQTDWTDGQGRLLWNPSEACVQHLLRCLKILVWSLKCLTFLLCHIILNYTINKSRMLPMVHRGFLRLSFFKTNSFNCKWCKKITCFKYSFFVDWRFFSSTIPVMKTLWSDLTQFSGEISPAIFIILRLYVEILITFWD